MTRSAEHLMLCASYQQHRANKSQTEV